MTTSSMRLGLIPMAQATPPFIGRWPRAAAARARAASMAITTRAWSSRLPIADLKYFWGALGCACWAA